MGSPRVSVVVFTFNRAQLLRECIESIRKQSFTDIEIVVSDNCSEDNTEEMVKSIDDQRIRYFKNSENLGLRGNLQAGTDRALGDVVYLMGDDDLLLEDALERTWRAFEHHPEVSMVTRPYYWFIESPSEPVRAVKPFDKSRDTLVTVNSDRATIHALFQTAGQISGLAFRRELIRRPYHPDIFTTHLYLFSDMLKQRPVLMLKDYAVAVRINESMCRHKPEIYEKSPTQSWMEMFWEIFAETEYDKVRNHGIDLMAAHCEGFIQIKSYGTMAQVIREIVLQIRYRPLNLLSSRFIVYSALCLAVPKDWVIYLSEFYKRKVLARSIHCDVNVNKALVHKALSKNNLNN